MLDSIFGKPNSVMASSEEETWLSVSDLMAGLMIVFLFISIVLMRDAVMERDKIKEIAATYKDNKVNIYNALVVEFKDDLVIWNAEINPRNLSFNFKSPEVLFDIGKSTLKERFKVILTDFFPRYLKVIYSFKESVEEVRIEGHTSSKWGRGTSEDDAYFKVVP